MDRYNCSIDNYISDEYSICREERQFALYLHNILLKYRYVDSRTDSKIAHIFSACELEECEIEYVFYEVAFLRDFFMRNRILAFSKSENYEKTLIQKTFTIKDHYISQERSFNAKLLEYCIGSQIVMPKAKMIKEVNYGHNNVQSDIEIDVKVKEKMRRMMNAKPDLAIVYHKDNKRYLLFLECKYESPELKYEKDISQRDVQGDIARFLCEKYLFEDKLNIPKCMIDANGKCMSLMVHFVRKEEKKQHTITLNDLIYGNGTVFE